MTRRSLHPLELLVAIVTIGLSLALLLPARNLAAGKAARTKCAGGLRQLGIAAVSYADDKRFYPHVGSYRSYDGDWTSSDPAKAVRTLLWYGYTDSPESFVCPGSDDAWERLPATDRPALKRWFWSSPLADGTVVGGGGRESGDPDRSPLVDRLADHSLDGTPELSYGWTRKGVSVGTLSTRLLLADRSLRHASGWPIPAPAVTRGRRGNHPDGWNLLQADAAIVWLPRDGPDPGSTGPALTDPAAWLVALGTWQQGELAVRPVEPDAW